MPARAVEPFTVMAKPVGPRCNMACSYCYYLETEGMYGGELPPKMSDGLLETYIRKYIEASPGPVVSFIWHGGEPTLARPRLLPQGGGTPAALPAARMELLE